MHRRGVVTVAVVAGFAVAGCGAVSPQGSAAERVALQFRAAVRRAHGSAACHLLSPVTAAGVAQTSGKPCPAGILTLHVGGTGQPAQVDAYGQSARVVFADDTVFLGDFPSGWRIMAAGCTPRGIRPYSCLVKGG
jgi:hypothetical protein